MSAKDAETKGLRLVPVWWGVVWAVATGLISIGANYATINARFTAVETHQAQTDAQVSTIQNDRKDALRDWTPWRNQTDRDVTSLKSDVGHLVTTVDRIADKLGVVPR